ncbi:hypothetical protein [Romboutsia sp. 1001713B170131_170501_G6]|uniref:hypothetical protein n=1 Tax=Romboutsia sp. 1001713B170131_170501_G6 TaxID=2787108 RepID=UPI0018A9CAEC|nr:hypothetical protein [Romboutsia sp. 1001713B170131_170501_G6]
MIIKFIKILKKETIEVFLTLGLACKYLIILGVMCIIIICISIFNPHLDGAGNMVTIRNSFSSIVGYILERKTKICNSDKKLLKTKVVLVGTIAIICLSVIIGSYIFGIDANNPSLMLLKNLLFSCIGFLTGASKEFYGEYKK